MCTNATCDDVIISAEEICSANMSYDVFYDAPINYDNDDDKCCGGLTIKKLAILISVPIFLATFIVVIGTLYIKGYLKKCLCCRKK